MELLCNSHFVTENVRMISEWSIEEETEGSLITHLYKLKIYIRINTVYKHYYNMFSPR
jgi:hypothetical protein